MRRGELWTAVGDSYLGKPRPVLVVQDDACDFHDTVLACLITTVEPTQPDLRVRVEPTAANGLVKRSWVMLDKTMPVMKKRFGVRVGSLADEEMREVSEGLRIILGL